ncbi:MAG: hypothetical protein JNL96_06665 [Planctomycetaceae bacterium]|nr:hypothetical protein [Planctomycetaceae bacterium]
MKRLAIVVATLLALAGGVMGAAWGAMIAAFAGDAGVSEWGRCCWTVAFVIGGACLIATPGLGLGAWSAPPFFRRPLAAAAAVDAAAVLSLPLQKDFGLGIDLRGLMTLALILSGLLIGTAAPDLRRRLANGVGR